MSDLRNKPDGAKADSSTEGQTRDNATNPDMQMRAEIATKTGVNDLGIKPDAARADSLTRGQIRDNASNHDAQMRKQIAMISLIGYFSILMLIVFVTLLTPLTDVETGMKILGIVAAAGSGLVGTIIGYYFGKKE